MITWRLALQTLALGALAPACLPAEYPTDWDVDGDGYGGLEDCDPDDPDIHPGADDPEGDAIDQNCDGYDGVDSDGDGGSDSVDCDDHDPTIYPGAPDPYGDGIDQDCDECPDGTPPGAGDGIDRDCDSYPANIDVDPSLQDCDDDDANAHPGADEVCDGVDNDCSGAADDLWDCDPGNCGDGTWGWLPVDDATIHVQAGADDGGNGSATAPFGSIQAGLDAVASVGGGMVAVAAGTYVENLLLTDDHDGVHLAGRCAELVEVDGSDGVEEDATLFAAAYQGEPHWQISGVALRQGPRAGIGLAAGDLSVSYTTVDGNTFAGILLYSADSQLSLDLSQVSNSLADATGSYGYGLLVGNGGQLDAANTVVQGNTGAGIVVSGEGSTATLTDVYVNENVRPPTALVAVGLSAQLGGSATATRLWVTGNEGPGLHVTADGALSCTECDVSENSFGGAVVQGGSLTLEDCNLSDTWIDSELGGGVGLYCDGSLGASTLQVIDSVFYDPEIAAVWLIGPGTHVIEDSNLEGGWGGDVLLPDGSWEWFDGVSLVATDIPVAADLTLTDNDFESGSLAGVLLHGASATLSGNSYSDNGVDLVWQDCDGVEEPIGLVEVPTLDLCPAQLYPVPEIRFQLYPD